jgi:hypothetical protein
MLSCVEFPCELGGDVGLHKIYSSSFFFYCSVSYFTLSRGFHLKQNMQIELFLGYSPPISSWMCLFLLDPTNLYKCLKGRNYILSLIITNV